MPYLKRAFLFVEILGAIFLSDITIGFKDNVAYAAETGTLRGTVRDSSTQALIQGVQVTLEGSKMPGGRVVSTDARGNFWFPVLPPGEYRITFVKDGYQTKGFDALVRLDQTTTLSSISLNLLSYTSEAIEVVDRAPVLDSTQSAITESVGEEYMNRIPLSRSYQGVIQTMPGVFGRIDYESGGPGDGNPSVRGEGRAGNNYFIEGFSIRDPQEKNTGMDIPFNALQEVVVYTDGAPAEFGSFTGMAANLLLKSGGNETHGSIAYNFDSSMSFGQYNIMGLDVDKRSHMFHTPVITLGGPIVRDKLWFFSVVDYSAGTSKRESATIDVKTKYNYQFMSRFTYSPFQNSSTILNFTIQNQGNKALNIGSDATTDKSATIDARSGILSLNANLKTVLSPKVVLEVKWNRWSNSFVPKPSSGDLLNSSYMDFATGYLSGNPSYLYSTNRTRTGIAFHLTRFVTEMLGSHVFKGGFEYHQTSNQDEFTYTGGKGTSEDPANSYIFIDNDGDLHYDENIDDPYLQTSSYNVGVLEHKGRNSVAFIQDQWQPITSMTLNLGLRFDAERLLQNEGREIINQWALSPRFGFAWDITGNSVNLVSANAGRYSDINGLSFANWGDTRSSSHYTVCAWNPVSNSYNEGCYTQDPVSDPVVFSSDLGAYYMDKATLGYTRAIGGIFAVGIKGIVSRTRNIPEDVASSPSSWVAVNPESKKRDFWGVELTVEKRFSDRWQLLATALYSQSKGTSAGSFESGSGESIGGNGNQVGVFLDDFSNPYIRSSSNYFGLNFNGLGYDSSSYFGQEYSSNTAGWYGYLPYHSFINAKLNASYQFKFGTELALVYEFDSGHAWQRRGTINGMHLTYPEGRGSRFMPPVHYLDLRLAHEIMLPKKMKLLADLTVFNILDLKTPINYFENYNQNYDARTVDGINYTSSYYDDEGNTKESSFGQVLYRQPPRYIRASLTFVF